MNSEPLTHPLFDRHGVVHGFGVRGMTPPAGLLRPKQVHGRAIVDAEACAAPDPPEADGVVGSLPGRAVGIVTADCVPVLLASEDGRVVAAVHAGWRGLAAGVLAAGVEAIRAATPAGAPLLAAIGPHIGPCCYEVDAPVLDALRHEIDADLAGGFRSTRPGHGTVDLGALTRAALMATGLAERSIGTVPDACTRCDARRFHSYRRDGPRAGRLIHFAIPAAGAA